MTFVIHNIPYIIAVMIFCIALYIVIIENNLFQKLIGLSILQSSILVFFISLGKRLHGIIPVLNNDTDIVYSNPLPHVLMLTAIVVGIATLAVGLSFSIKIQRIHGTLNEKKLDVLLHKDVQ